MYKIVKCPNCKNFQMSLSSKIFSCKFCLKKDSILKMRIYFENSSPGVVNDVLKKIKQEQFNVLNDNVSEDFESAFK